MLTHKLVINQSPETALIHEEDNKCNYFSEEVPRENPSRYQVLDIKIF
jgi:hypothetical protein